MYFVYMLQCIDRRGQISIYTGQTNDLEGRVRAHQEHRGARYTRSKSVVLWYHERFTTRAAAMQREREIKRLPQQQKLELIRHGK